MYTGETNTYFWVRVFDYVYERDSNYESEEFQPENYGKGVLLDEFYTNDITDKEDVKRLVKNKYCGMTAQTITFAKPRKKDGIYAIVMDSNKFFYDRFYRVIDTFCFWHECHKHIQGKYAEYHKININGWADDNEENERFFCSPECKRHYSNALHPMSEGEFQEKQAGQNGDIFGYIYLIYNRAENIHYIGQTRYLPFFRWQEHVRSKAKGDIKDLSFSVLTEVVRNYKQPESYNQQYLNSIEAWWIAKYQEEGYEVKNVTNPKITIEYLQQRYDEMIAKNNQLSLIS